MFTSFQMCLCVHAYTWVPGRKKIYQLGLFHLFFLLCGTFFPSSCSSCKILSFGLSISDHVGIVEEVHQAYGHLGWVLDKYPSMCVCLHIYFFQLSIHHHLKCSYLYIYSFGLPLLDRKLHIYLVQHFNVSTQCSAWLMVGFQ